MFKKMPTKILDKRGGFNDKETFEMALVDMAQELTWDIEQHYVKYVEKTIESLKNTVYGLQTSLGKK